MQIDDILAAVILSLAMMRRLEVRTTSREDNPQLPAERFDEWRRMALRGYSIVAIACFVKVALNTASYALAVHQRIAPPWPQISGGVLFAAWLGALVWAWKIATDARVLRLSSGILLRREVAAREAAARRASKAGGAADQR
jgi:hypothetical protein